MAKILLQHCLRSYAGCSPSLRVDLRWSGWRQVEAGPEARVPRAFQDGAQFCDRCRVVRCAAKLHVAARALDQQIDERQRFGGGVLGKTPDLALDLGPVLVRQPPLDRVEAEPDVVVREPGLPQQRLAASQRRALPFG